MDESRNQPPEGRRSNGAESSPTKRGTTREKVIAGRGRALATRREGHGMHVGCIYSNGCDIGRMSWDISIETLSPSSLRGRADDLSAVEPTTAPNKPAVKQTTAADNLYTHVSRDFNSSADNSVVRRWSGGGFNHARGLQATCSL